MTLDTTFPKGQALADWMGTSSVKAGYVFANVTSLDPGRTQTWATSGTSATSRFP